MKDASIGALVPSVSTTSKPDPPPRRPPPPAISSSEMTDAAGGPPETFHVAAEEQEEEEVKAFDKDLLCPICMGVIKDAFLTACGHSFCYMCVVTHLNNKSDCPCCGLYLTKNQLFPNFLLNKRLKERREQQRKSQEVEKDCDGCILGLRFILSFEWIVGMFGLLFKRLLKKTSARQIAKTASPIEHLRMSLQQGCEMSIKDLDSLISLLGEKKRNMEQHEAETNMQILLEFLHCLRKQKLDELKEVQTDLQYIKEDINAVERHRLELYRARERYSVKLRMLHDDPYSTKVRSSNSDRQNNIHVSSSYGSQGGTCSGNFQVKRSDIKIQGNYPGHLKKEAFSGSDSQHSPTQSGLAIARKRRVHSQFNELQECYLQKRRNGTSQPHKQDDRDVKSFNREGYHAGLEDFQSVLTTFTRYSRLRVIAELRHGDLFHSANIVSSIEFDRDDELFATAGVSKRIKVFEFSTIVNEPADIHCPIVEMSTRSKLSCLSWNKYSKNIIASSDYEGIVTVWDVNTRQSVMEYEEHEKRAWSVDFSRTEPSMLVSGSDDCKVKVWCTKQEASALNIDMKANICCVKYNPGSSVHVAVGSADHHIHYFDLRNPSTPLHVFRGHRKAVSYVKFLSNNELASASTDSTLRLWDVKENCQDQARMFKGHTNEKNFVGLTVNNEYIACGSETNEVYVYHKAISRPAAWHRFSSTEMEDNDDESGSYFISAVCWKSDSPTMLAANSQGTIKVLVLAA